MRKLILYYKNIVQSLTQHQTLFIKFIPIFILKKDIQGKETITSNATDGNVRLLGDSFCSTSAEPRFWVYSPPQYRKIHLHRKIVKDTVLQTFHYIPIYFIYILLDNMY